MLLPAYACAQAMLPAGAAESPRTSPAAPAVFFADTRLRYESVEQDLRADGADALTWAGRFGAETALGSHATALIEVEGVLDLRSDDLPGSAVKTIPDAGLLEINRAQLSRRWGDWNVTVGRQRLGFDDERFLGGARFRQNEQTYDAARVTAYPNSGPTLDVAYFWRVNRTLAENSRSAAFTGESVALNLGVPTAAGRITGFVYALDLSDESVGNRGRDASSLTTGASLTGGARIGDLRLDWRGEYAHQEDYGQSRLDHSSDFHRFALAAEHGPVRVTATHQSLGDGGPLSFQTPLASIHGVLGAADMFASTPDGGLRATALGGHWIIGDAGAARNLTLQVVRHWFKPADAGRALGEEWNVSLTTQIEGFRLGAEFASYEAETFAGDTRKAWLTIARTF